MNTGGITSYLLNLTGGLIKLGHRVMVVSSGGDCVLALEAMGAKHLALDIKVKSEAHPKLWLALPRVKSLIAREQIDLIHAQTRVTQVMGSVLSRLTGKPMITTCHGFFRPRLFRRLLSCWGQGVIAISRPVKEHLLNDFKVDATRIHLVPNGIDLSQFEFTTPLLRQVKRQQWRITADPMIGIIARLSTVKGIDVLLKAMPEVLRFFPKAQLMIVGEGPEGERLKAMAFDLGLGEHVRFDPIVNRTSDVLPLFNIFVMPSLQEGLGLSVMEAQAAGIPVVVSNVGGLPDLVSEGQTGLLVNSGDAASLAGGIVRMLKDPIEARRMAQQARLCIETTFDATTMAQATVKVYEEYTRR